MDEKTAHLNLVVAAARMIDAAKHLQQFSGGLDNLWIFTQIDTIVDECIALMICETDNLVNWG